ncbi:hypothetical protein D3C80_2108890 [compost metagenome]
MILICRSATSFFQLIKRKANGMERPIKALTAIDDVIWGNQIEVVKVMISSMTMAQMG